MTSTSRLLAIFLILLGASCTTHDDLGHGYSRKDGRIYHEGKRIDLTGASDLTEFARVVGYPLKLATRVDAASFRALSVDYSVDKNRVYYKWISGVSFWVVEVPAADVATFEALGLSLARDQHHVWLHDRKVEGADPKSMRVLTDRVWVDAQNVWFYGNVVDDADPKTFVALGDGYHYKDANRVYWIFNVVKVVPGADPKTFKP